MVRPILSDGCLSCPVCDVSVLLPNGCMDQGACGPGDIVLDGDPSPPKKRYTAAPPSPLIGPCLLWPNGWMDQDTTWYGARSQPRPYCVRWEPRFPQKGAQQPPPPHFSAHVYWAKRSPISVTAELLLKQFTVPHHTAFSQNIAVFFLAWN